jgi:hypothetical protein
VVFWVPEACFFVVVWCLAGVLDDVVAFAGAPFLEVAAFLAGAAFLLVVCFLTGVCP